MQKKQIVSRFLTAFFLGASALVAVPVLTGSPAGVFAADNAPSDAQLMKDVRERLGGKNFKDITLRVNDGIVTLSGQVELYGYKADALKKAKKTRGVRAVRDNIAVGGPTFPDAVLQQKLLSRIQVDRVGFGQVFDAISVGVRNGVVLLGGHALGPVAEQSAYSLTEYTPGVKDVINQIRIDPVSMMDDGIRRAVFNAIYGYGPLQPYAIDPARPIRISVENGRVTLYGIVNNQMDSTLAYTRAMQVPNVFQVTNDLLVANQGREQSKPSSSSVTNQ